MDLRDLKSFHDYGRKNAVYWYEYVNGTLGRMVENGSLYLVTGCDKASSWAVASFSNKSADNNVSLSFNAIQVPESRASYNYSWETHSSASVRIGPVRRNDEEITQNQCVFIRGFKFSVRDNLVPVLKSSKRSSVVYSSAPLGSGPFMHGPGMLGTSGIQWSSEIQGSNELADSVSDSEGDVIVTSNTDLSQVPLFLGDG